MLSAEQLAKRRTGVTSTDVAPILGLSRYRTPLDVYLDKIGQDAPKAMTYDIERGTYLEPGMRGWYAQRVGARVIHDVGTVLHPSHQTVLATPDGLVLLPDGEERALEIKVPGEHTQDEWGQPGTDEVPREYLLQGLWEMAVLDVPRVDFAVLLRGDLAIFPVARDMELEGELVERALRWWRDHVVARRPPPPTSPAVDGPLMRRLFPRDTVPPLVFSALTAEQQALVVEYLRTYRDAHAFTAREKELAVQIKAALGESSGLVGLPPELGYHRIDWRADRAGKVSWRQVACKAMAQVEALRLELGEKALEDLRLPTFQEVLDESRGAPSRPLCPRALTEVDRG